MEKKELNLLNRIYQDAGIGMQSIDKVMKKIEDDNIQKLLDRQFDAYEKIAERCEVFAINDGVDLKDNGMFKKFKQTAMIYLSLWTDKTPRHILEMMITGTVMGIIDTIKSEKDLKPKNPEIKLLLEDFKKMQDDFYEKLKKQLAKV